MIRLLPLSLPTAESSDTFMRRRRGVWGEGQRIGSGTVPPCPPGGAVDAVVGALDGMRLIR